MVFSTAAIEPGWSPEDYVAWTAEPDLFYKLNYINVSVLTLGVVFFFTLLFRFLKQKTEGVALAGFVFVPIYGVLNLLCYSLQISQVPSMALSALDHPESIPYVAQWIQANPASVIGFINGMAYAVLGIPSILYGYLLFTDSIKFAGLTLLLNGVFCVLGMMGMMLDSKILAMGIMVGGFLFLVSLGCFLFETGRRREQA
jgi:hypothetical protein